MEIEPDLVEWNYGEYEGLTSAQIHGIAPGWMLFTDGMSWRRKPGAGRRASRSVIRRIQNIAGRVAVFAHGHVFRVFAARWIGYRPRSAATFC